MVCNTITCSLRLFISDVRVIHIKLGSVIEIEPYIIKIAGWEQNVEFLIPSSVVNNHRKERKHATDNLHGRNIKMINPKIIWAINNQMNLKNEPMRTSFLCGEFWSISLTDVGGLFCRQCLHHSCKFSFKIVVEKFAYLRRFQPGLSHRKPTSWVLEAGYASYRRWDIRPSGHTFCERRVTTRCWYSDPPSLGTPPLHRGSPKRDHSRYRFPCYTDYVPK